MKKWFHLYGAAFDGTYISINQCEKFAVNVFPCSTEASFPNAYRASAFAQAASDLVSRQFFIKEGFPNRRVVDLAGFHECVM